MADLSLGGSADDFDLVVSGSSYSFIEPITPRVVGDPVSPSSLTTAPAAPVCVSPAVLQAQFVAFGVAEESCAAEVLEETHASNLVNEFNNLDSAQQQTIAAQILEITAKNDKVIALKLAIDNAPANYQDARSHWRDLARVCGEMSAALAVLQTTYAPYVDDGPLFATALQNRKDHIEILKTTADNMKQREPTQAAGDMNQFDEMMFQLAKSQNSRRARGMNVERIRAAEAVRRNNMRRSRMEPFRTSLPALPASWHALDEFRGGAGHVVVYAEDDGTGRIKDRIVVKDTKSISWGMDDFWYGVGKNKVPVEFYCHRKLVDTGSNHILGLADRECIIDDRIEVETYRIFLEYAPNGDLLNLVDRHRDAKIPVPETFILYAFRALIDACLAMKRGRAGTPSDASWQQMVHRDLKLDNVLLGERSTTSFPAYPEVKLMDFGMAIVTTPTDKANPNMYNTGAGTPGYLPPEQIAFRHPTTGEPIDNFMILSPCNVWGLGAIMLCFLENRKIRKSEQPNYMPNGTWRYTVDRTIARTKYNYSDDLCTIVDNCLRYEPDARPTLEQLETWILQKIAANEWLANQSDENAAKTIATPQNSVIVEKNHRHYVGMALSELIPGMAAPNTAGGASDSFFAGMSSEARAFFASGSGSGGGVIGIE